MFYDDRAKNNGHKYLQIDCVCGESIYGKLYSFDFGEVVFSANFYNIFLIQLSIVQKVFKITS